MRTFLLIGVLLIPAGAVFAAPVNDTYVIPLAGHVSGANGETWTTEVILHNIEATTLVVDFAVIGDTNDSGDRTISVPPHGTVALTDLFEPGVAGALVVAGSAPFSLRARVHTTDGPRGSFGADIAPVTEFPDAQSDGVFLPGLSADARHRSSIGFLALAGDTDLIIEVAMLDSSGSQTGARTFVFDAGSMAHVHFNAAEIGAGTFDHSTARVRITSGDGVVTPYATVVDNISSDAAFVSPANSGPSGSQNQFKKLIEQRLIRGKR
jgi:hypothetical protein